VEDRLAPLFAYLRGSDQIALSEQQVVALLARRPVLLGLNKDNARRIVGYLEGAPPSLLCRACHRSARALAPSSPLQPGAYV
jgi:hypothetical protein